MPCLRGFAPIANRQARVLILGSMPGDASLSAGQYYAHAQNAFWPIMGAVLGFDPSHAYAMRTRALRAAGIALWDVMESCERKGSLDADIRKNSIVANDFGQFFSEHALIKDVLFNGSMAEESFRRHVLTHLDCAALRLARMPSTSPANASFSRSRKLDAWRTALGERGIIAAIRKEHV